MCTHERGQTQVATALGLLGITTAVLAAVTIIRSVTPANSAVTDARASTVPLDAALAIILLGVLLAVIIWFWRSD